MSDEDTFWISLSEKFFGILLIVIGVLLLYFTATSTVVLGVFSAFFGFLCVVVMAAGAVLILVRPPE